MRKRLLYLLMLMPLASGVSAQDLNLPGLTSPKNVKVVDIGRYTEYVAKTLVTDSLTGKQDTVYQSVPEVAWQSQGEDIYNDSKAPRRAITSFPYIGEMTGSMNEHIHDTHFMVFVYEYESVDCDGNPVTLSGIASCPDKGSLYVNNVVVGTHITITSDNQAPSKHRKIDPKSPSDWSVILAMAAYRIVQFDFLGQLGSDGINFGQNPEVERDRENALSNYRDNLVIMPDYEGYGSTKDRAHPYLYQELTARQVCDGVQAAIYAYQHSPELKSIRFDFRPDWRMCIVGYSQGGAVAMATHRFMEQNHLDEEFRLTGSLCGDGPYDLMSTLMYYTKRDLEGHVMSMPVVLPLIVKGMLDTNPYMRTHKAEDYFQQWFIDTNIMKWIEEKNMSTGDIERKFQDMHKDGKDGNKEYYKDLINAGGNSKMRDIMNAECYAYFKKIYEANKDTYKTAAGIPLPTKRGVMEDLHLALASNDMTEGWTPKHPIKLFHSDGDTVVPYDNAERAVAQFGNKAQLESSQHHHDHVDTGQDFLAGSLEEVLKNRELRLSLAIKEMLEKPLKE